ncbi:MAG: hypothetical protein Q6373_008105 [Candidatus Sigynarchaeota archaeon]
MKRIVQLIITAAVFIASMIGIEFLIGLIAGDNAIFLASLGNFPGHNTEATYIERYTGFLIDDTLGWFSYTLLGAAQDLEIVASYVFVHPAGLSYISTGAYSWSPFGLVPIMIEAHPWSTVPEYFLPALLWLIKLVVPFIITGIVAGLVAKEKKQAIGNALLAFIIVGVGGIVLNIIHIYMNIISLDWKFTAMMSINPAFTQFVYMHWGNALNAWVNDGMSDPIAAYYSQEMVDLMVETSIVSIIFAVVNGLILSIVAVIVARKK